MSYRLKPLAEIDVENIADYIARDSPAAAVEWVRSLHRRWELLATQPRSGARREALGTDVRHVVSGNYVAYYRLDGDDIEILRVAHGHRNIVAQDLEG